MKKANGWGLSTMVLLLGILVVFGLIAIYYIYQAYSIGVLR